MADKNYIGQAKTKVVEYNGGSFTILKVGICLEDMGLDLTGMKLPAHIVKSPRNGKHYFDFEMSEKRAVDEYGNSHSVYFTERPNPSAGGSGTAPKAGGTAPGGQSTSPYAKPAQSASQRLPDYPEEEINPEDIPF